MSRIEYNPSLNDKVAGQLGDLNVEIQIPLSSIKTLFDETPPASYKVYTALVTQSGGDDPMTIDAGTLTIGVTYYIQEDSPGMDFTNVGAPNNIAGESTYFVATGTTPASWGSNEDTGNGTLAYNAGAPTVTVLENTIGNIWFTYSDVGKYYIYSNDLFTSGKMYLSIIPLVNYDSGASTPSFLFNRQDVNELLFTTSDQGDLTNDKLSMTPIEIRVYN